MIKILLSFVLAFSLAFAATPMVRGLAVKFGAVDVPDERRIHKKVMPRMGGLAIFIGFIVSAIAFCKVDRELQGILIGSTIIVVMGILDDIFQLSAKVKLVVQLTASFVVLFHGVLIHGIELGTKYIDFGWVSYPLTIIWIILVTNAVNLIDGLDGLAAGVSSISSVAIMIVALLASEVSVATLTAALAGACLGFLPYNVNPAKLFMGDTGSNFLGFVLATISVQGVFKSYAIISFVIPFLILGLPIFDTSFAILRRIVNKKPIMAPDRGHLHHRLLDMGYSQKESVGILYVICIVLCLAAVILVDSGPVRAAVVIVAMIVFFLLGAKSLKEAKNVPVSEDTKEEQHD